MATPCQSLLKPTLDCCLLLSSGFPPWQGQGGRCRGRRGRHSPSTWPQSNKTHCSISGQFSRGPLSGPKRRLRSSLPKDTGGKGRSSGVNVAKPAPASPFPSHQSTEWVPPVSQAGLPRNRRTRVHWFTREVISRGSTRGSRCPWGPPGMLRHHRTHFCVSHPIIAFCVCLWLTVLDPAPPGIARVMAGGWQRLSPPALGAEGAQDSEAGEVRAGLPCARGGQARLGLRIRVTRLKRYL